MVRTHGVSCHKVLHVTKAGFVVKLPHISAGMLGLGRETNIFGLGLDFEAEVLGLVIARGLGLGLELEA